MLKDLAKSALKAAVKRLPWGANEALFEALCTRMGAAQILARCNPRLDYLQLCACGNYGLIQSALGDGVALPAYGRTGVYEPRMAALFREFFASHGGGTYLDIGAHIGLTTIPVAQDPTVRCLAFEPDPVNNRHLCANVDRNCPNHNVTVHQIALFADRSTLNLALSERNPGDHRLTLAQGSPRRTVKVEAAPLDQFRYEVVGALAAKIDTQGAEPFVIAGGREVLSGAGLVALEFAPGLMHALGSDPHVVLEFLAGFERIAVSSARGDDLPVFRPAREALLPLRAFLSEWRSGDARYCDVFASRDYWGGQFSAH